MKKETINTFDKGMIRDLHPLTTPNNVLTDALNATLVTYNGNENILQNDMGNTQVGTAFLPAGYIPVGMKEYGGIVYVAAYNPKTGKGQIGSFPSPLLLWASENWSVDALESIIDNSSKNTDFYRGNTDFITKESCKIELFTTNNGPTIFHPGDKFIIKYNKEALLNYVSNGYVSVQLGVVKQDGSIEIMRTWSKSSNDSSFLYWSSDEESLSSKFNDPLEKENILVFDASSSGYLILILNLHTLDSFNLTRVYDEVLVENDKKIKVTFSGEGYKDNILYLSTNPETTGHYLGLVKTSGLSNAIELNDKALIEVTEASLLSVNFSIYPRVPIGIIDRMKRQITINFNKIRKSEDEFKEWRFYVTEKYVKIGWAYDFYNLDHTKEIEYIRMYFHKLLNGYTGGDRVEVPYVTFQRENFNGNFEDYINYTDAGIQYKNIYIVEIVKKFKNTTNNTYGEEIIDFKTLYLTKLYNNKYNKFYENNAIGDSSGASNSITEYSAINTGVVQIKLKCDLNSEITSTKIKLLKPGDASLSSTEFDISLIRSDTYATPTQNLNTSDLSDYQYVTQIKNIHTNTLQVTADIDYDSDLYIGSPNPNNTDTAIRSLVTLGVTDNKQWIPSTTTTFADVSGYNTNTTTDDLGGLTVSGNVCNYPTFTTTSYRLIQGKVSDIQSTSYESIGLKPLYSPNYTADKKNKIAPYWSLDSARCIAGAGENEDGIYYNSSLRKDGGIIEGPNSGGGFDDGGLSTASNYMGNPMTNIFTGLYGEEGELTFDRLRENTSEYSPGDSNKFNFISRHTENGGNIISYQDDNFLITCWKFTDGNTHLVNLATARYPNSNPPSKEDYVKSTCAWPRLDVILRCLLSLIFVATRMTNSVEFITASDKFYQYLEGDINLNVSTATSGQLNDALVISDDTTVKTPYLWLVEKWGYDGNGHITASYTPLGENTTPEPTGLPRTYDFTNLIPDVKAEITNLNESIKLPNYNIDTLMSLYLNAGFKYISSNNLSYDPKVIYKLDTSLVALNASACAKTLEVNGATMVKANIDGAYEWIDTPACVPITGDSEDGSKLSIHRWNDPSDIIDFPDFGKMFKTKGAIEEWTTVPEGEDNEVYAIDDGAHRTPGNWTNAVDENAPDMYYTILYSPKISVLNNYLSYNGII